jgi:hypothetical protein
MAGACQFPDVQFDTADGGDGGSEGDATAETDVRQAADGTMDAGAPGPDSSVHDDGIVAVPEVGNGDTTWEANGGGPDGTIRDVVDAGADGATVDVGDGGSPDGPGAQDASVPEAGPDAGASDAGSGCDCGADAMYPMNVTCTTVTLACMSTAGFSSPNVSCGSSGRYVYCTPAVAGVGCVEDALRTTNRVQQCLH